MHNTVLVGQCCIRSRIAERAGGHDPRSGTKALIFFFFFAVSGQRRQMKNIVCVSTVILSAFERNSRDSPTEKPLSSCDDRAASNFKDNFCTPGSRSMASRQNSSIGLMGASGPCRLGQLSCSDFACLPTGRSTVLYTTFCSLSFSPNKRRSKERDRNAEGRKKVQQMIP